MQPPNASQVALEIWLVAVKPLPVMTTVVPPVLGPKLGVKPLMTGLNSK